MINTLTLNPAVDRILYLDQVKKNTTNRVRSQVDTVGGKGTHVSMNLSLLEVKSRAFGLAYGATGKAIADMMTGWGVQPRFVMRKEHLSRTNYLLVEDTKECTLIAEKGVTPSGEDTEELVARMKAEIQPGDYLVLSGDASNYPDPFIYNRITRELRDKRLRVFLDSSGETLRKGLLDNPFLIKPNLEELSALCGREISSDRDVVEAIRRLDDRYQIQVVAVSLGGDGAIVRMPQGIFKTFPPDVEVFNTIGCGDCFLAGLLCGFQRELPPVEILRLATAVSSATAASPLSVGFDKELADSLIPLCLVEQIG